MNKLNTKATSIELKVGDGVTVSSYSDAAAYTVVKVNGKRATLQADDARLLNGVNSGEPDALHFEPGGFCGHTSGVQRWETSPNQNGALMHISLRKDGTWRPLGQGTRPILFGRHPHYDFNF